MRLAIRINILSLLIWVAGCGSASSEKAVSAPERTVGVATSVAFTEGPTVDAQGNVTGTFRGTTPSSSEADIVGKMDCATGVLDADLVDGSYRIGGFPFSTTVQFTGTLDGVYDPGAGSFAGTWTVTESNPSYGGDGMWSAS